MFVSPAKGAAGGRADNKPRKLFLEEEGGKGAAAGPRPPLALPADLSPALWVQAAN